MGRTGAVVLYRETIAEFRAAPKARPFYFLVTMTPTVRRAKQRFMVLPDSLIDSVVPDIIRDVARSEILPRFNNLSDPEISEKTVGDVVTIADERAEAALTERLSALLPGSLVVGEEAVDRDAGGLRALAEDGPVWVIDPLDGTLNFAGGLPIFAVMVACLIGGRPVASWIYDPVHDRMARAQAGGGSYLDDKRIRFDPPTDLARMTGVVHTRFGDRDLAATLARASGKLASVLVLHCAGFEYLAMLHGRITFSIYHRGYAWDHLPGLLLVEEAGGHLRRIDGSPYRATDHALAVPFIAAGSEACWETVRVAFFTE